MPHTECAHRQAQTQISTENPTSSCSVMHLIRPTGHFLSKAKRYRSNEGFTSRCSLYRHQSPFWERVSTTHHDLYPQFEVQSRNVNSSTFCLSVLSCPSVCHCRSRSSRYLYSKVNPSFFLWPHFS